ncbi:MutT/NUDIX hydrolase [Maribacter phage Colly_1]|uniref:NUDIX domain-containing protein n=1 Tax=Maribacter phage Colly_1 TaxID=2745691 RepID=A0A8E4UXZ2_9CAUD|nr:MutT/NUDIX hydrolase [Maribacter phage Colly_1]QQO97304.1 NUDIX domain-containing protein [Maribacter phage Colly_1]
MDYKYKTAVGIVINDDNEILLGRCVTEDDRNGMLCFPGGGIDKGEDIFSAAIREVQEETNISCHVDKMVFVTHSSRPTVAFVMLKPEVGFMDPKFNDEYDQSNPGGWFPLDNLPTAEVLNNNLDILRNFKLVTGKVEYAKDNINESSNMKSEDIKSLIESNKNIDEILLEMNDYTKNWKPFLKELSKSSDTKTQLKTFKKFYPKGVMGEDFYPGISKEVSNANDILNKLISKGFMKYKRPNETDAEIEYTSK